MLFILYALCKNGFESLARLPLTRDFTLEDAFAVRARAPDSVRSRVVTLALYLVGGSIAV